MKKTKRKINFKRIFIFLLLIVILVVASIMAFSKTTTKPNKVVEVKEVDSIEGYEYSLKETASKYYEDLFGELKKTLEAEEVDESKYAELVGKMFVADFFTLSNKISKNDVGGKQFVYTAYQSDFENLAMDTVYKTVESNVYGDRDQELPLVTNVEITSIENGTFTYGDTTDDNAYVLTFNIEYDTDMGYQTTGTLTLIHQDNKLEVAAMTD